MIYIIAEAGVNHNGSFELAKKLIDVAAESGADAVKFQTFNTDITISRKAVKAEYQKNTTDGEESQYDMVKKLEFSAETFKKLADYCKTKNIQFLSTPFDLPSVDVLNNLGVPLLKISSGEVMNGPLILKAARTGLPIVLSTGISTLADVEQALGIFAYGYLGGEKPSIAAFKEAYSSPEGQKILKEKMTLLHCTTEYPCPLEDVNLSVMKTMHHAFGLPVGYSDHTAGITVPIAAAALGATLIEKHFTLDKNMPGPDHQASLDPQELAAMVKGIRDAEKSTGNPVKVITHSERKNISIARKSLVASKAIKKGEIFTEENLSFMRPGNGIPPVYYWEYLGKQAGKDYDAEEMI